MHSFEIKKDVWPVIIHMMLVYVENSREIHMLTARNLVNMKEYNPNKSTTIFF
jgi:hypothetical protein